MWRCLRDPMFSRFSRTPRPTYVTDIDRHTIAAYARASKWRCAAKHCSRSCFITLILLAHVNSRSRSLYAIARPSVVSLSVCLSSVTFVRPTQTVQIFGNISTALGTLAIHGHPLKILRRSSPSAGGVKDFGPIDGYISETVLDRR